MLRPHFHRLVLTGVLMAGFVGAGVMFGHAAESRVDAAAPVPAFSATIRTAAEPVGGNDAARPDTHPRDSLTWPFFSFGRSGKRTSW